MVFETASADQTLTEALVRSTNFQKKVWIGVQQHGGYTYDASMNCNHNFLRKNVVYLVSIETKLNLCGLPITNIHPHACSFWCRLDPAPGCSEA